ncbi:MAG TPA: OsmC family protein [Tepidisphaeraceae bacterium]|nr:OsmC family protein [Tepidisphaeraceae bacterium]
MFRKAEAEWSGNLAQGKGHLKTASGAVDGAYDFKSRFENGAATNPEELLGAAHAGCFSMALSHMLASAGHAPTRVHTTAKVHLEKQGEGFVIPKIELDTEATVPGISADEFQKHANAAKAGCPVSKALAATTITLNAKLV